MYNTFNSNFSADKWLTNISLVDVSVYTELKSKLDLQICFIDFNIEETA